MQTPEQVKESQSQSQPPIGVGVSASDMIMGDTGTGKTALLGTLAEYVWETYQKITLCYSADAGGWPSNVQALVDLGIMRVWKLKSRDPEDKFGLAFETCIRACQGYWPKSFRDPRSGMVEPRCELVAPITQRFKLFCKNGHLVTVAQKQGELKGVWVCAPKGDKANCGLTVSLETGRVELESFRTPGFENVGAVSLDGITSMGYWGLQDLGDRGARVEEGAKDQTSALRSGTVIESGDLLFGSSTMQHYGQVQTMVERALTLTGSIPFLVTRPVWTALKKRGTDEGKVVIYGPDIPGSAKTALLPRLVGNLLATEVVYDNKRQAEYRLYLRRYELAGDTTPTLCKTRVSPGYLKQYLTDGPLDHNNQLVSGVKPFTEFSLKTFYMLEAQAIEQERQEKIARYQNAPGIFRGTVGALPSTEEISGKPVVMQLPAAATEPVGKAPVGAVLTTGGTVVVFPGPGPSPAPTPGKGPGAAPAGPGQAVPPGHPGPGAPQPQPVSTRAKGPGPAAQPTPPAPVVTARPPTAPQGPGLVPPAGKRPSGKKGPAGAPTGPLPPAVPTARPE